MGSGEAGEGRVSGGGSRGDEAGLGDGGGEEEPILQSFRQLEEWEGKELKELKRLLPRSDWQWKAIEVIAAELETDGCTGPSQVHQRCCWLHDCMYRTHKVPVIGWDRIEWVGVSRYEADWLFCEAMAEESELGGLDPIRCARWLAVRIGGWRAWHGRRGAEEIRQVVEGWVRDRGEWGESP